MNVLVVEDDENKREQLVRFLRVKYGESGVCTARSYQSGLRLMLQQKFDAVLLDMSMPTFDKSASESGGRFRPFGGKELIAKMDREGVGSAVIVVTQFESFGEPPNVISLQELENELRESYPRIFRGVVYYNAARSDWMAKLEQALVLLVGAESLTR